MLKRAAFAIPLIALGLANCADDSQQADGSPPVPPATWPLGVDANYKGTVTLADARLPNCPPGTFGKIEIGDRTLYLAYQPDVLFVAPIQPDGSVFARSGPATLQGSIVGQRMAFTVSTPFCASSYDLNWVL